MINNKLKSFYSCIDYRIFLVNGETRNMWAWPTSAAHALHFWGRSRKLESLLNSHRRDPGKTFTGESIEIFCRKRERKGPWRVETDRRWILRRRRRAEGVLIGTYTCVRARPEPSGVASVSIVTQRHVCGSEND